ncbi:FG-GAP-like repeat-containing protein, partial [Planctomycetaceae bacterium]|nr:FG-GAP-like repeat-containing protein [Planctomycetaceae bacterium]
QICVAGSHESSQSVVWNHACSRVAFESEDWKSAASLMEQVYRTDPNHQLNCYYFGLTARQLGQKQQAQALLNRAIQLDNVNRLALRLARETDSSSLQSVPLILELAAELSDLSRFSEAADWYVLAARIAPENSEISSLYREAMRSASSPGQSAEIRPELDQSSGSSSGNPSPLADTGATRNRKMPQIAFVDVHESAGLDHTYFNGQTGFHHLIESMGGGVIVIDYDEDGWDDLYFPQGCHLSYDPRSTEYSDRLFRNLRGKRYMDVTQYCGLGSNRYGLGGTAFDYDNDGDQDLFVTNFGLNQFYQNNGDGTFSDRSEVLDANYEEMSTSVAAADFNGDGFLDLYVANYLEGLKVCRRADGSYAPCDPGNFQGQMDRLLISDGSGLFSDRSTEAGLDVLGSKGLGVVAGDLDKDGRIDVYVANDGVPNFLWKNVTVAGSGAVRFEEMGLLSGTAVDKRGRSQAGMGLAIADFNRDMLPDLYVTNFFEEHNTLYLNRGDGWFEDRTKTAGLYESTLPLLGFGTVAQDFNGDGTKDLLIVNGHIFRDDSGEQPWKMPGQIFANFGRAVFEDQSLKAGEYFDQQTLGRGVAVLDWNCDGRCDAVIVHQDRPAALLENRGEFSSPILSIDLVGNRSNRDALGAEFRVAGDRGDTSYWMTSGGYLGDHSQTRQIAAESKTRFVHLQVIWPGGTTTDYQLGLSDSKRSLGIRRHWVLTETGESFSCPD